MRKVLESARKKEDVGAEVMKLRNNVTCRVVMSTRCSEQDGEAEKVRELVKESYELAAKLCFGDMLLERVLKEHEERR